MFIFIIFLAFATIIQCKFPGFFGGRAYGLGLIVAVIYFVVLLIKNVIKKVCY
jgi:hypothetical protein